MNQPSKKILLLIEDNDEHAEIAQFYIEEYANNVNVIRLADGKTAIDYIVDIRKNTDAPYPWLILLDINLPKYNGHEVLARLKADSELIEIPVVVFTSSNSNKDVEQALKAGANSYIQKPIEPDEFSSTISKILDYWSLNQHELIIEQLNYPPCRI